MDRLLEQIRARIAEGRPNDYPNEWLPVQPPVGPKAVAAAEAELGFRLPDLLRRLYTEVGNGGFGPAFGLIPLSAASLGASPPAEAEFDLVREYQRLRRRHAAEGGWPARLVPAFYCGCAVFEFVDCAKPAGPVTWFDEGTEGLADLLAGERSVVPSLEQRLGLWLAGSPVW